MLYEPLSHLSSLYGAASDNLKGESNHTELAKLGDSVLSCLAAAHQLETALPNIQSSATRDTAVKAFVNRASRVQRGLNIWIEEQVLLRILLGFERQWEQVLENSAQLPEDILHTFIASSKHRQSQIKKLQHEVAIESQALAECYAEPVPLT